MIWSVVHRFTRRRSDPALRAHPHQVRQQRTAGGRTARWRRAGRRRASELLGSARVGIKDRLVTRTARSDRSVGSNGSSGSSGSTEVRVLDLRLVPIAISCWVGAAIGTTGSGPAVVAALVVAAVLLSVLLVHGRGRLPLRQRSRQHGGRASSSARCSVWLPASVAVVLVVATVLGVVQQQLVARSVVSRLAESRAIVVMDVTLSADPKVTAGDGIKPAFLTRRVVIDAIDGRGRAWRVRTAALITVTGDQLDPWRGWPVGARVRTVARLLSGDPGTEVAALARVRGPTQLLAGPSPGLALVERVRAGLRSAVAHRPTDQRALVPALVLGDSQGITEPMTEAFQTTALTHLMAVSGANLTLLLAFVLLLARWLGVRGWWLRWLAFAGVLVFVALCRSEPSVLRAAAMGVVALLALGISSAGGAVRNLSLAAIVLVLVDPWLSRSYGFGLSVLASAGIIWWSRRWAVLIGRWLPMPVAEALAISMAAHLATLPVIAVLSGRVSVVGVLANLAAGPFVGPATVFGFAAAGLSLVSPPLAAAAGWAAGWSAQVIVWVARFGAGLPGASMQWPTTPVAVGVLSLAALFAGVCMPLVLRHRWLASALVLIMIVATLRPAAQPGWPGRHWQIVACDVGQGDGVVVRVHDHQAVVFDSGPDPGPMKTCLDALGVRGVPLLIFTHFHADHVGGLDGVLAGRQVGQIWLSPYASPPAEAARVLAVARAHRIPTRVPMLGEQVTVGSVRLQIFGPVIRPPLLDPIAAEDSSSQQNEESIVTRVSMPGLSMLETGDIEPTQQAAILDSGVDLRADVLKIPHHGSAHQDPAFIAATGARLAIASAGLHNDYGHPAAKTIRLVQADQMTLLRTDQQGSVAIGVQDGRVVAVAQKS